MTVVPEPLDAWEPHLPRLGAGAFFAAAYWTVVAFLAVRAYEAGFHRYLPRHAEAGPLVKAIARDSGLWSATTTAAGALALFVAVLVARNLGRRLPRL